MLKIWTYGSILSNNQVKNLLCFLNNILAKTKQKKLSSCAAMS